MNTFFSQLKKEAQKIRLSETERERMRLVLERTFAPQRVAKSPRQVASRPFLFFTPRLASSFAFVLLLAVFGGSTAYAAEGALPGDLLYPVKVGVNEKLAIALAVSPQAKAQIHAHLAERRIQEAEALAAKGVMTEEAKAELEQRFNESAQVVEDTLAAVEKEDPVAAVDVSTRFESAVAAHSALLAKLGGEGSEISRNESRNFAEILKERGRRFANVGRGVSVTAERSGSGEIAVQTFAKGANSLSASVTVRDSDDAVIARIETNASTTLEEAVAQLDVLKGSLDASTSARVGAQLEKIRAFIEKFRKEKGKTSSERQKIEQAFKDAATLKTFLEAQEKFHEHVILPAPQEGESGESNLEHSHAEGNKDEDRDTAPLPLPISPSL